MNQWPSFSSFNQAYSFLAAHIANHGQRFRPRGKACIELRPAAFTIDDCTKCLYTGESRQLNYRFLAVETLSYLAGWGGYGGHRPRDHAQLLVAANKNVAFAVNDETGMFSGAYGPALLESYADIEELLAKDPMTRQAVACIWYPGLPEPDPDIPCTVMLHFFAEPFAPAVDSEQSIAPESPRLMLSMAAYMRSNDINWGTPYDVAAFAAIQCAMADATGMAYGRYSHFAGSLHVYEEGNSGGERPPTVTARDDEIWLKDFIANGVPRKLGGAKGNMHSTSSGAHIMLEELAEHKLTKGLPFREFKSRLEKGSEYWSWWAAMVRRQWNRPSLFAIQRGMEPQEVSET